MWTWTVNSCRNTDAVKQLISGDCQRYAFSAFVALPVPSAEGTRRLEWVSWHDHTPLGKCMNVTLHVPAWLARSSLLPTVPLTVLFPKVFCTTPRQAIALWVSYFFAWNPQPLLDQTILIPLSCWFQNSTGVKNCMRWMTPRRSTPLCSEVEILSCDELWVWIRSLILH